MEIIEFGTVKNFEFILYPEYDLDLSQNVNTLPISKTLRYNH